jgi:hypothetical protein
MVEVTHPTLFSPFDPSASGFQQSSTGLRPKVGSALNETSYGVQ